ncbi:hypothetical protein LXA43DRAFT_1068119 [Ganoderma leucocontextum]|nr:hypothetical protein LXA43DRAFT_1068119 [Ganoderma leucocontextum]
MNSSPADIPTLEQIQAKFAQNQVELEGVYERLHEGLVCIMDQLEVTNEKRLRERNIRGRDSSGWLGGDICVVTEGKQAGAGYDGQSWIYATDPLTSTSGRGNMGACRSFGRGRFHLKVQNARAEAHVVVAEPPLDVDLDLAASQWWDDYDALWVVWRDITSAACRATCLARLERVLERDAEEDSA